MPHRLKVVSCESCCASHNTFDASFYFTTLRACGGDPVVWNGSLYWKPTDATERIEGVARCAAELDPRGEIRLAYAKIAWDARPTGAEIVKLG